MFEIFGASGVNSAPFWDPKRIPGDGFLVIFIHNEGLLPPTNPQGALTFSTILGLPERPIRGS